MIVDGERLLDWMTHCHVPMCLQYTEDGLFELVDQSKDTVIASAAGAFDALKIGYERFYEGAEAISPRRCVSGDGDAFNMDCLFCGAPLGGVCQDTDKREADRWERV